MSQNGTWVPLNSTRYDVDLKTVNGEDTLELTLPDDLYLRITYNATVQAKPYEKVDISNNAHWEGYASPSGGTVSLVNYYYKVYGTVSGWNAKLKIIKRDLDKPARVLSGATFTVTEMEYDMEHDSVPREIVKVAKDGQCWECTTNDDGIIEIDKDENDVSLKPNTIYRIEETGAPAGYVLDRTPHYFVVANANMTGNENLGTYESDSRIKVCYQEEYTYTARNEGTSLTVVKQFADTPEQYQSGEFTFGLYQIGKGENGEVELIQTKKLILPNEENQNTVVFRGLEIGEHYYVREMDKSGNPIAEGKPGMIGENHFRVSYSEKDEWEFEQGKTVTVTNTLIRVTLPKTGGIGTAPLYLTAVTLMLTSALPQFRKKRREE